MTLILIPCVQEAPKDKYEIEIEWMIGDADGEDFTYCLCNTEEEAIRRYELLQKCAEETRNSYGYENIVPDSKDEPWMDYSYEPTGAGVMNCLKGCKLFYYDKNGNKYEAKRDAYTSNLIHADNPNDP